MNGESLFIGMSIWHIIPRHISTNISGDIKHGIQISMFGKL